MRIPKEHRNYNLKKILGSLDLASIVTGFELREDVLLCGLFVATVLQLLIAADSRIQENRTSNVKRKPGGLED